MPSVSSEAVLLVDGYNIIGAWPKLGRTRDRDGLEASRYQLIELLLNYSAFQGFDTRIVFDAQYRDTPSKAETITENLSVHYTDFGQTADSYIEKACANFRYDVRKFQQRLIVATSDRAQQLTVVGYGAEWMSAHQLAAEIESSSHRIRQKHKPKKPSSSRFLVNSLDATARQRLAQLRMGLD